MKPYRPPDWEKINPKPIGQSMGYGFTREDMYKRGEDCADAILEVLKSQGKFFVTKDGFVSIGEEIIVPKHTRGYVVVIPDEEKK